MQEITKPLFSESEDTPAGHDTIHHNRISNLKCREKLKLKAAQGICTREYIFPSRTLKLWKYLLDYPEHREIAYQFKVRGPTPNKKRHTCKLPSTGKSIFLRESALTLPQKFLPCPRSYSLENTGFKAWINLLLVQSKT